jgi:hypothetical protein
LIASLGEISQAPQMDRGDALINKADPSHHQVCRSELIENADHAIVVS